LANPVPGQDEQDEFAAFVAEEVPSAPAQVAQAPAAQEDEFAEFAPAEAPAPEVPEQVEGTGNPILDEIKDGFQESLARVRVSFGVTPNEKMQAAAQVFGEQNVRLSEAGDVERFSRKMGDFVPLDEDGIELLDDALDFSRDLIEGVVENSARALGIAAAPLTGGTSAVAGGAAGAVLAKSVGDLIQEKLIGVPIDPERNLLLENAVAAGLGSTFNFVSSSIARRAATAAARKKIAVKSLDNIVEEVEETLVPVRRLQEQEVIMRDEFGRVLPGQVGAERIPEMQDLVEKFKNEPSVQSFLIEQKKAAEGAFDGVGEPDKGIAETFRAKLLDGDGVQGALIGSFRKEALANLKGKKIVPENLKSFIDEVAAPLLVETKEALRPTLGREAIGFRTKVPEIKTSISLKKIKEQFDVDTEKARRIKNSIQRARKLAKGANFLQIRNELESLKGILKKRGDRASATFRFNAQLRAVIANDEVDFIGRGVEGTTSSAAFQTAKNNLFKLKNVENNLKTLLKDPVNARTFTRSLFESGKNISRIKDVKTVAELVEPGLWDEVVVNWLDSVKLSASKFDGVTPGSVNWNQVSSTIGKLDPQAKKAIFNEQTIPLEVINDTIKFNQLVQNSENLFKAKDTPDKLAGFMADLFKAGTTRIGMANLINRITFGVFDRSGISLQQFLAEGGVEKVLSTKRMKLVGSKTRQKISGALSKMAAVEAGVAARRTAIESLPQSEQLLQGTGLEEQGQ
jgi:hypothetical protein